MKRTQLKDALRNIWKQKVSYLSIIVIAFLGVTTFLGIDYTDGALRRNGSIMYDSVNYRDIEIISTQLLSMDDLDAILDTEGVTDAEPVWQIGAKVFAGQTRQDVNVISLTERINLPQLVEGRLPEKAGECAVEARLAENMGWHVGDSIQTVDSKGETAQYLKDGKFVITGIANHPDHASNSIPDTFYVMVQKDAFDMEALDDCFMKAEITAVKPANVDRFNAKYDAAVAEVQSSLEALAEPRTAARDEEVRGKVRTQIDEGQAELDSANEELLKARTELDDGWIQLSEGEDEFEDGTVQITEAKAQLDALWEQLQEGLEQLIEAEDQLAAAEALLNTGYDQLIYARSQLDYGRTELLYAWNQLEDAKENVRTTIRLALESVYGEDTSGLIPWASRTDADLDYGSTSAADLWITDSFKFDITQSLNDNIASFICSGEIPDEALIAMYEILTGGDE